MAEQTEYVTCPTCGGTKQVWDPSWNKYFTCHHCKGLGIVKK